MSDQLTFKELFILAGIPITQLCKDADVNDRTASKAINSTGAIRPDCAQRMVQALNKRTGKSYTIEQVKGLEVTHYKRRESKRR